MKEQHSVDLLNWPWRPWLVPAALATALAALLIASGLLWVQVRVTWDDGAVAVAKEEADNLFTLDHRTAEKDYERVLNLATGKFREEYAAQRDKVVDSAQQERLVSTASVPDGGAAVEYFADSEARVLVALDVSSSAHGRQDKRVRLRVALQRVDDAWLVSGMEEIR